MAESLPHGIVTFLFTDIEGSTKLWQKEPEWMDIALARHDNILRRVMQTHHGYVFKTMGDAFCVAFADAQDATLAAIESQHILQKEDWGGVNSIRVRMALHTGMVNERDGDYFGPTLNLVARLLSIGHGEQILISKNTINIVQQNPPIGIELRDLGQHYLRDIEGPQYVYQASAPGLRSEFPPLKSQDTIPNNLPAQLTSFIGRQKELADLGQQLLKERLLTLLGPGGTGKTKLSLELAKEVLSSFSGGVWFIEFAALSEPQLVLQTVAATLGLREITGTPLLATLADYLRDKQALLVLDNCEHLVTPIAGLVDTLLGRATSLHILASSREAFGIPGEVVAQISPLAVPDQKVKALEELGEYEAIRLFCDRARVIEPNFTLTERNAPSVIKICQRLEGIPLALELAAARVKMMNVEEIARRLENRFGLLVSGSKLALPRQQTLQALIDWSYNLLTPSEQLLFSRLSIFAGSWSLRAVEKICSDEKLPEGEILDLLSQLANKSLVNFDPSNDEEDDRRYRFLETIREYASAKLVDGREGYTHAKRHLEWYGALAAEGERKLRSAEQAKWLIGLEKEHDNLRAALGWALHKERTNTEQAEEGLFLAANLGWFWFLDCDWSEGRAWLEKAIMQTSATTHKKELAWALNRLAILTHAEGDYVRARALYEESLDLAEQLANKELIAWNLYGIANILNDVELSDKNPMAIRTFAEKSLSLFREMNDIWGIAYVLSGIVYYPFLENDISKQYPVYEESLTLFKRTGDNWGIAQALRVLASLASQKGDFIRARVLLEEGLNIALKFGYKERLVQIYHLLADIRAFQGDYLVADNLYKESIRISEELGYKAGLAVIYLWYGLTLVQEGKYDTAKDFLNKSLILHTEMGNKEWISLLICQRDMAIAQGNYKEGKYLLEEDLKRFSQEEAGLGASIARHFLGLLALLHKEYSLAKKYYKESLPVCYDLGDKLGIPMRLMGLSSIALGEGDLLKAARLMGAIDTLLEVMGRGIVIFQLKIDREEYSRSLEFVRINLDEETFTRAWNEGRAMSNEDAIAYALAD